MMEHLAIYNALRAVPDEAKKAIGGGRLKGMTDINPMWRIKALTEQFGPCGTGWKYEVLRRELCPGAGDEVAAFVDISLYVRDGELWSAPIPGTGGSMFVSNEKNGPYTSDECFKMALTDAIGVACKALGMAADVYWEKARTKYDQPLANDQPGKRVPPPEDAPVLCADCGTRFADYWDGARLVKAEELARRQGEKLGGRRLCAKCGKAAPVGECG